MVPTGWLSVLLFLLLVAPGLAFEILSERRRATIEETTFREISRLVLASFGFTLAACIILVIVGAIEPEWMPNPGPLLTDYRHYLAGHYELLGRTVLLLVALDVALVYGSHRWLSRRTGTPMRNVSGWQHVLSTECPPDHSPWVRIKMTDGSTVIGELQGFTPSQPLADREIILGGPMWAQGASQAQLTAIPGEYQRIVIGGPAIASISVFYRRATASSTLRPAVRTTKPLILRTIGQALVRLGQRISG